VLDVLAQEGVEPIPTIGTPFDPYLHVATVVAPGADAPPETVLAEEKRGYRSREGVLRYAEVVVARPLEETPG
jgi:molecular chaperone GrpE